MTHESREDKLKIFTHTSVVCLNFPVSMHTRRVVNSTEGIKLEPEFLGSAKRLVGFVFVFHAIGSPQKREKIFMKNLLLYILNILETAEASAESEQHMLIVFSKRF